MEQQNHDGRTPREDAVDATQLSGPYRARPLAPEPDEDEYTYQFEHIDESGEVIGGDAATYAAVKRVLDSMTDDELTAFARGESSGGAAFIRVAVEQDLINPPPEAVDLFLDPVGSIYDLDAYYARRGLMIP